MERLPEVTTQFGPSFGRLKASEPPARAKVADSDTTARATILQTRIFFMRISFFFLFKRVSSLFEPGFPDGPESEGGNVCTTLWCECQINSATVSVLLLASRV